MTKPDALDERELFEAWFVRHRGAGSLQLTADGFYASVGTQDDWEVWQAGRASMPAIPPGWQLVPIEPTEEMLDDDKEAQRFGSPSYRAALLVYRAMLKAAPTPPQGETS